MLQVFWRPVLAAGRNTTAYPCAEGRFGELHLHFAPPVFRDIDPLSPDEIPFVRFEPHFDRDFASATIKFDHGLGHNTIVQLTVYDERVFVIPDRHDIAGTKASVHDIAEGHHGDDPDHNPSPDGFQDTDPVIRLGRGRHSAMRTGV